MLGVAGPGEEHGLPAPGGAQELLNGRPSDSGGGVLHLRRDAATDHVQAPVGAAAGDARVVKAELAQGSGSQRLGLLPRLPRQP